MRSINKFLVLGVLAAVMLAAAPAGAKEDTATRSGGVKRGLGQQIRETVVKRAKMARAAIGQVRLTAINGTTLTVEKDGKTYTVLTGDLERCTTKFVRKFGGKSELAELTTGDSLSIVGRWQDEAKTIIEACLIRDLSIQKRRAAFVGRVESLTGSGFVMSTVSEKRANQTVTVGADTKIVNRREETIPLSDVKAGHRVRVKGLWNNSTNTVTEVTHIKDYDLPAREKD